jgi:hypothetical protein
MFCDVNANLRLGKVMSGAGSKVTSTETLPPLFLACLQQGPAVKRESDSCIEYWTSANCSYIDCRGHFSRATPFRSVYARLPHLGSVSRHKRKEGSERIAEDHQVVVYYLGSCAFGMDANEEDCMK